MIKNIIFDFGGVLIDWDPRYFYRSVFNDEKEMEFFLANICTSEWNSEHDRGVPFAENIAKLQVIHPEYREEIGLFREGWSRMLRSDMPESVAILREVMNRGYSVYGLTNWSDETIPELFVRYPYFKLLKGIVVSGREKVIKPDKRIYNILLERYGLKADECVFIDDNAGNVKAAEEIGIHGIVFKDATQLRSDLESLVKD